MVTISMSRRLQESLNILLMLGLSHCDAFYSAQPASPTLSRSAHSMTLFMSRMSNPGDDEDAFFDVEAERRRLEDLMERNEESSTSPLQQQKTKASHQQQDSPTSLFDLSFLFPKQNPSQTNDEIITNDSIDTIDLSALEAPLRVALSTSSSSFVPLTAMEIERRELEMELLLELEYGDETNEELLNLWFQERGAKVAEILHEVEQNTTTPDAWDVAEDSLRELILQHGVSWVEPVHRLATLYYVQGRLHESQQLYALVLHHKPWHFGALSGIVMVYAALHDVHNARQWAARRLPAFGGTSMSIDGSSNDNTNDNRTSNRRRRIWVQTSVEQAKEQLTKRQQQAKDWWGATDQRYGTDKSIDNMNESPENSWQ